MHDPMTVAFDIRSPFARRQAGRWSYRPSLITIWHRDPEKRGNDNSCDWAGFHRPLNAREQALADAWGNLSHTLGNPPFYPDVRLYGTAPHTEDDHSLIREMNHAFYTWQHRGRIRWHPRWHVHHWRIQVHPVQKFRRWAFSRCVGCGRRYSWGYAPVSGQWGGSGPRWFRSESNYHQECFPTPHARRPEAMESPSVG